MVLVSGGFDPIHSGHIRLLKAASKLGNHLTVALNTGAWLQRKKGYEFMAWEERAEILAAIRWVDVVVKIDDADDTVREVLRRRQPDKFCNGGDRTEADPREHAVCEELEIEQLFGIGGRKTNSSSALVDAVRKPSLVYEGRRVLKSPLE